MKILAQRDGIPVYQFQHEEKKDDLANEFRRQRPARDGIVFIGVAQEKAQAFQGRRSMGNSNDAVLPFPLRQALDRVDAQLDLLIL